MSHPLVVNVLFHRYDIYIGRYNRAIGFESDWHNPFNQGTKEENIQAFIDYLAERPDLLKRIPTLRGKRLGCWCAPHACHGDILAELANRPI